MPAKTVLVTGANGFLGSAVAKAFSLDGWKTYGLVRNQSSVPALINNEVIPVVGSAAELSFLSSLPAFDVIVSTTEDIENYVSHFQDTVSLLKSISKRALKKPLVLFTSGCKDYGTTKKHGEAGLAPHTEEDSVNPPKMLSKRTNCSLSLFDLKEYFDAIVLRPTTLYGYSGSYYAVFFTLAQQVKADGYGVLTFAGYPNSILHGTHVDDVAAAYLALASSPREVVAGQIYNISSTRYETLTEVGEAIQKSYGIKVEYKDPETTARAEDKKDFLDYMLDFPQWVGSEKIRKETGWMDKKLLFSEGFELYRKAYEQSSLERDERAIQMQSRLKARIDGLQ